MFPTCLPNVHGSQQHSCFLAGFSRASVRVKTSHRFLRNLVTKFDLLL